MFAHPLGLLALLALPAIVALHLFRRRYRRRVTSALFLWGGGERTPASGRRRERLLRSPSLLAELLAALALALALAGPRCAGPRPVPHLVAILDGSASLGAKLPGGSPAERAARRLRERLDALPRSARVTLIESGPRSAVVVGPAAPAADARAFLEGWRPRAPRHDEGDALTLALRLASTGANGVQPAIEFYTDRFDVQRSPDLVGLHAFGAPAGNVALVGAHRRRGADGERLALIVANLGGEAAARRLRVEALDAPRALLAERDVRLAAGGRTHLEVALPAGTGAVRASLDPDRLAIDDEVFLAPALARTVRLASDLDPAIARTLALERPGEPPLARWLDLARDVRLARADETPDVLIAPAADARAAAHRLLLHVPGADAATASWVGPFLVERGTAPLGGLSLEGVVWTGAEQSTLPGAPVVAAGGQPLATRVARADGVDLHLDLDPARSTLQRAPDWPILLADFVELARDALPGPRAANLRAGEALTWTAAAAGRYGVRGPLEAGDGALAEGDGPLAAELVAERPRTLTFPPLAAAGLYALEVDGERVGLLGQSFADEAVSDLRDRSAGDRPSAAERATVAVATDRAGAWLAALALLALVADVFVLRPRGREVAA